MNDKFRATALKKSAHIFISGVASRLPKVEYLQSVWNDEIFAFQILRLKPTPQVEFHF